MPSGKTICGSPKGSGRGGAGRGGGGCLNRCQCVVHVRRIPKYNRFVSRLIYFSFLPVLKINRYFSRSLLFSFLSPSAPIAFIPSQGHGRDLRVRLRKVTRRNPFAGEPFSDAYRPAILFMYVPIMTPLPDGRFVVSTLSTTHFGVYDRGGYRNRDCGPAARSKKTLRTVSIFILNYSVRFPPPPPKKKPRVSRRPCERAVNPFKK